MDHRTLTASLESGRRTRRMLVTLDDTRHKLTRQEMPHRLRRVRSLEIWRMQRWMYEPLLAAGTYYWRGQPRSLFS